MAEKEELTCGVEREIRKRRKKKRINDIIGYQYTVVLPKKEKTPRNLYIKKKPWR